MRAVTVTTTATRCDRRSSAIPGLEITTAMRFVLFPTIAKAARPRTTFRLRALRDLLWTATALAVASSMVPEHDVCPAGQDTLSTTRLCDGVDDAIRADTLGGPGGGGGGGADDVVVVGGGGGGATTVTV